jgi:8-oxo-dGTP pyrophosphatase MutT (NUDIX family)
MRVVILWLINENGEILMAKRAAHMSTDAGVWGPSVSGKVDENETLTAAVLREMKEELGFTPDKLSPTFLHHEIFLNHTDGRKRDFYIFYASVESDITRHFKLESNEVESTKWFKRSEIEELVAGKSNKVIMSSASELWQKILKHLQPITT